MILALIYTVLIPAINDAVANNDATVAGDVMNLGGGVSFVPAIDWQVESGSRVAEEVPLGFGGGSALPALKACCRQRRLAHCGGPAESDPGDCGD